MDRMKISMESTRYIDKYVRKGSFYYHMLESSISDKDVLANPDNYDYVSIRIPFRVIEGKTVSYITLDSLSFERDNKKFIFKKPSLLEECRVFILYMKFSAENIIVNLILQRYYFFNKDTINHFSKIKIKLNIISP